MGQAAQAGLRRQSGAGFLAHTHQANKQGNLQLASIAETGEDDLTSPGN
jgi:hypothetical protein